MLEVEQTTICGWGHQDDLFFYLIFIIKIKPESGYEKEGDFNMIKTEENQKSSNVLEALRLMSESVSDTQILELFEGSASEIYNDVVDPTAQKFVDINEIKNKGNNGLDLLYEISKNAKFEPFNPIMLNKLLKDSTGLDLPEWMKSPEEIVKARKVTAIKKLKNSLNKRYCDSNVFVADFISLFDLTEFHPAVISFRSSFYGKQNYMTGSQYLQRNQNTFEIFLMKVTQNRLFLKKPISIYFSLSSGKLSRFDDGNSFIVADLDLKISDGTMNTLMSTFCKKDSNPIDVVRNLISSGLKRKYLYLSKNKATFDGFKKGRVPFSLLSDKEIWDNLQSKGIYDLKELRKIVPKLELNRYDSIVDGLLGR
jgi:hypothetical protein